LKKWLSDVAYTLAPAFTLESYLSQIQRVLFLKVFFHIWGAVTGQLEARDITNRSFMVAILCVITEGAMILV